MIQWSNLDSRNREAPCYTQEQVVKINQSFINDTDLINKLQKGMINQFSDEIKRQQDLKQNLEIKQDKLAEEADLSFKDLSMQALKQGWDQHTEQVENLFG